MGPNAGKGSVVSSRGGRLPKVLHGLLTGKGVCSKLTISTRCEAIESGLAKYLMGEC